MYEEVIDPEVLREAKEHLEARLKASAPLKWFIGANSRLLTIAGGSHSA